MQFDEALPVPMVEDVAAFDAAHRECLMLRRVTVAAPAEVAWLLGPQRGAPDVPAWLDERKPGARWRLDADVLGAEFDPNGPARVRIVAVRGAVAIRGECPLTGRAAQSAKIDVESLEHRMRRALAC